MHEWQDKALCSAPGADPEWWFAQAQTSPEAEAARRWCDRCPAKEPCLLAALREETADHMVHGIRGGLTATQRRRMRLRQESEA